MFDPSDCWDCLLFCAVQAQKSPRLMWAGLWYSFPQIDFLMNTMLVIALVLCTCTLEIISVVFPREGRNILQILFMPKIFSEREIDGKMASPYDVKNMRNFCFRSNFVLKQD
jgi:hypothetical protein